MSNLTTFFGGGGSGGSSVAQAANIYNGLHKNVTPLQGNTLSNYTNGRGVNPNIVPLGDDKFWLFEGNSTSQVYVSVWSVDAESGAITQLASAVQVSSDSTEVAMVASNNIDRAMMLGGSNYNKIWGIHYDSSSQAITVSFLTQNNSNVVQNMCHVTCLADGTLLGSIGDTDGSRQICYYTALFTDGSSYDLNGNGNNIVGGQPYGRMMGTSQGLFFFGPHYNNGSYRVSGKVNIYQNKQIVQNAHNNQINSNYYGSGTSSPDFMLPTPGGIKIISQDNNFNLYKWVMNELDGRAVSVEPAELANSSYAIQNTNVLGGYADAATAFCRQGDGSYIYFGGGSRPASTVTFSDSLHNFGYRLPFRDLTPISTYTSGDSNPMGGVLLRNNVVLRAWYHGGGNELFIDTYKYNG